MRLYDARRQVTITEYVGETSVIDQGDGTFIAAIIDSDRTMGYEACGSTALQFRRHRDRFGVALDDTSGCCDYCRDVSAAVTAAVTAWNNATESDPDAPDYVPPAQAVINAAEQGGFSVAGISPAGFKWEVRSLAGDLGADEFDLANGYLVVSTGHDIHPTDFAEHDARNYVAHLNGETWIISTLTNEQVLDRVDPREGRDVIHGHIWNNVNEFGESTPTNEELLNAL